MILSEYEWQAVELSLKVSGLAVVCSLPFGILMARVLVRCRFPARRCWTASFTCPRAAAGGGGLFAADRHGRRGHRRVAVRLVRLGFSFGWRGAALASAVVAFPLMVRATGWRWRRWIPGWSRRRTLAPTRGGVFHHHAAAVAARRHCRRGAGLRPRWGSAHHHFVSNIPGETRTIPLAMPYALIETPGRKPPPRGCA